MKFDILIEQASPELIEKFDKIANEIMSDRDLTRYGYVRQPFGDEKPEVYFSGGKYVIHFYLKEKYGKLENSDPKIRKIMQTLKKISTTYVDDAKISRTNLNKNNPNELVIKIKLQESNEWVLLSDGAQVQ